MSLSAILQIVKIDASYGALPVLRDVSIEAQSGQTVAILGPNGHGKTALMRAISGLLPLSSGAIIYKGKDITVLPAHRRRTIGIGHVPQGDLLFPDMSVSENLEVGAYEHGSWPQRAEKMKRNFLLFPELERRQRSLAGTLSGGERRMLAIARAIMAPSDFLLVDEPSIGLAPSAIIRVYETLHRLKAEGVTILLVEETLARVEHIADNVYLMDHGRIVAESTPQDLAGSDRIRKTYLG